MIDLFCNNSIDIESFINHLTSNLYQGDLEDKKVTASRIQVNQKQIELKRQERIDNLTDQMKGLTSSGGKCFRLLRVVFKVIDILSLPLSALSLNQLKMTLSKTLDLLKNAKDQDKLFGIKIEGQTILQALEDLKKFLSDDMQDFKIQDQQASKDVDKIMKILDELHQTYEESTKV